MARFLAFVAAVAMVVGAVVLRARIDDRPALGAGSSQTLICATELGQVCTALAGKDKAVGVTVEPAGVTAARLKSADVEKATLDAWLVPQPWPAIVDEARQRAALPPLFEPKTKVLARSPLVIAVWTDRSAALSKRCGRAVDARCIADAAAARTWDKLGGQPAWGEFKPFVADPSQHASGLIGVAAETLALSGSAELSSAELDDDKFSAAFAALARAIPNPTEPSANAVHDLLTQGAASLDLVVATESEVGPAVASSSRRTTLQVIYPSPVLTADVVLARRAGGHVGRITDFVEGDGGKKVLNTTGWRVSGIAPINGVSRNALPATNGLPSAGLLDALGRKWQESSR